MRGYRKSDSVAVMGQEWKKVWQESSFQRMPSQGDEVIIEGISIGLNDSLIRIDDSAKSREQRDNRNLSS